MAGKQQRKKRERFTTPIGVAVFPYLHAPDTKFNEAGVYRVRLAFPAEEAQDLVALLEERHEKAYKDAVAEAESSAKAKKIKRADTPWGFAEDDEGNEDESTVVINFKMIASGVRKDGTKWSRRPALFDGVGRPVPAGTQVGNGSKLRVNFEIQEFYTALVGAGVSLRLNAAQIIELVEWGGGSAEDFGFDAVNDGFEFAEDNEQAASVGAATDSDDDEAGEDEEATDF